MLKQILREPFFQFLIIGAGLFGAYGAFGDRAPSSSTQEIIVDQAFVRGIVEGWRAKRLRPPTDEELRSEIHNRVREQILYREGLARGLDEGDIIVSRRIAQKMEFLIDELAGVEEPTEEELKVHFELHSKEYQLPRSFTFSQILFATDREGESSLAAANKLYRRLTKKDLEFSEALGLGDSSMVAKEARKVDLQQVTRLYGRKFSQGLEPFQEVGLAEVIPSEFGHHLVFITKLEGGQNAKFSDVREKVLASVLKKKRDQASARYFEEVKSGYKIRLVDVAVPGLSSSDL